jgi:polar amino acid transport system substrate-binding protein
VSVVVRVALAALLWAAGADAAQHEGIEAVKQRGYLRICSDPSNLPYSSSDPATPGFEVELARLIARELGVGARLEWHPTYVRALKPLRDGACELFMGLPVDARFREGNPWIAVSRPYYTMTHAIVTKPDSGASSIAALHGQRVAVEMASIAEHYVGYLDVERKLYRTQEQAFRGLVDGEAVAAFVWLPVAAWLVRGRSDLRVIVVSADGLQFPIGAGVRRRDPGLAAAVDAAVQRLLENGEARGVLARYGVVPVALREPRDSIVLGQATVLAQATDLADRGRSLFSTACSRCHGAEGVGGGTGGAVPVIKNYDGGWEKFSRLVMNGRKNTAMGGFKGILTDEEVRALYEYLTARARQ